jgi:hypothetical protein
MQHCMAFLMGLELEINFQNSQQMYNLQSLYERI